MERTILIKYDNNATGATFGTRGIEDYYTHSAYISALHPIDIHIVPPRYDL